MRMVGFYTRSEENQMADMMSKAGIRATLEGAKFYRIIFKGKVGSILFQYVTDILTILFQHR